MNLSIHMVYLQQTPSDFIPCRTAHALREGETLEQLAIRLRLEGSDYLEIRVVQP